jgi:hypothetical protein
MRTPGHDPGQSRTCTTTGPAHGASCRRQRVTSVGREAIEDLRKFGHASAQETYAWRKAGARGRRAGQGTVRPRGLESWRPDPLTDKRH